MLIAKYFPQFPIIFNSIKKIYVIAFNRKELQLEAKMSETNEFMQTFDPKVGWDMSYFYYSFNAFIYAEPLVWEMAVEMVWS